MRRRAAALLLLPSLALGAAAFAIVFVLSGLAPAVVAGVAVAVAAGVLWWRSAATAVLAIVGARMVGPEEQPRLHNLVEGLCAAAGVYKPGIFVVDDRAPNAMSVGRSQRHASVVVTTGLVEILGRVELEGVLAHEISHIRGEDILASTVAAATIGPLAAALPLATRAIVSVTGTDREQVADMAAISLTRYPPGLISALEKTGERSRTGRARAGGLSAAMTSHLWFVPPTGPGDRIGSAANDPDQRVQALREL